MPDHTCQNPACGASFTGRSRKFCRACLPDHAEIGHKAYMDRYNVLIRARNGGQVRECHTCGKQYQSSNTSRRCWDCTKAGTKRCYACGEVFTANDGRLKCERCRYATCVECGSSFDQRRNATTCSAMCREAQRLRRKRIQARRRHHRRRGAIKGPYHDLEVFDRDGWRCQICGGLTRPWHRVPHPLAPTIDHIVALDADGSDTAENVQCAHFRCNSGKGPRAANDQLRLVG